MKDLLRFDTIVAACALLMSAITAGAMVYQTRVLQDQFSATVWPYLAIEKDYGGKSVAIRLVNQGVGPALIRSAQVWIDGKATSGWDKAFFSTLLGRDFKASANRGLNIQDSSVGTSTAVRAGDSLSLIRIDRAKPALLKFASKRRIDLAFCYCSINGRCWTLRSKSGLDAPSIPQPVAACRTPHSIAAPTSLFQ